MKKPKVQSKAQNIPKISAMDQSRTNEDEGLKNSVADGVLGRQLREQRQEVLPFNDSVAHEEGMGHLFSEEEVEIAGDVEETEKVKTEEKKKKSQTTSDGDGPSIPNIAGTAKFYEMVLLLSVLGELLGEKDFPRSGIEFLVSEIRDKSCQTCLERWNRDIMIEYSKQVYKLGTTLFELLSEALELKPDHLIGMDCAKGHFILCHYYPACPEPELTMGTSKHSDPDFLTILLQDHIGGLQIFHQSRWIDVPPVPGAVVVNTNQLVTFDLGDLQRYSKKFLVT